MPPYIDSKSSTNDYEKQLCGRQHADLHMLMLKLMLTEVIVQIMGVHISAIPAPNSKFMAIIELNQKCIVCRINPKICYSSEDGHDDT